VITSSRDTIIREDAIFKGIVRNGRRIEIYGYVEGELQAAEIVVHQGGRLFGRVRADSIEILGTLQGEAAIKNLISIRSSGSVIGNVRYGKLAVEPGGNLSAEVRNVPPELAGDFNLVVGKGRAVTITTMDLDALDPDTAAKDLVFSISNARHGWVALAGATGAPVSHFTQADLASGKAVFVHDGTAGPQASFDVLVTDHAGATSGAPRTVTVTVRQAA
jgi:cytoskeletal protein CcmA (bactofilin family)